MAPLDPRTERGGLVTCAYCGTSHRVAPSQRLLLRADLRDPAVPGWLPCDRKHLTFDPGPPPALVSRSHGVNWINVLASQGTFDDFEVRVTVRFLDATPNVKAGLQLRTRVDVGLYLVWITQAGLYSVVFLPWKGDAVWLVPWNASPALHKGPGAANQVAVVCQGSRLRISFNGEHASTVRDERMTFGTVRLLHAGTEESAVAFSNLEVTEVPGASDEAAAAPSPERLEQSLDVVLTAIDPTQKIMAIKVVREQTGLGLAESKNLVERTPQVLKRGLSRGAAERVAALLRQVGARVELRQSDAPAETGGGAWEVRLLGYDPGRKIQLIKAVMDSTRAGLAASKDLVENAPSQIRNGVSRGEADSLAAILTAVGGRVEVKQTGGG